MSYNRHTFSAEAIVRSAAEAREKAIVMCADYFGDLPHEWSVTTYARTKMNGDVALYVADVEGWLVDPPHPSHITL